MKKWFLFQPFKIFNFVVNAKYYSRIINFGAASTKTGLTQYLFSKYLIINT